MVVYLLQHFVEGLEEFEKSMKNLIQNVSLFFGYYIMKFLSNKNVAKRASSFGTVKPLCSEAALESESDREDVKNELEYEDTISNDVYHETKFRDSCNAKSDLPGVHNFKPIYSIGYWNDPDDIDNPRASVAILTFSGIGRLSDFSMNIIGGRTLVYKVVWPACMTVSNQLHVVWIDGKGYRKKLAYYHGMVKCFDVMYAPMRRHDGRVETSASIPLNMKVETRPEIHLLAFPNNTAREIYVIIRGPARRTTNLDEQELVWEELIPSFSIVSIYRISLEISVQADSESEYKY